MKFMYKSILSVFSLLIIITLFSITSINAQVDVADVIKFSPVPQNNFAVPNVNGNEHPPDARALKIERRLKELLPGLKLRERNSSASHLSVGNRRQTRANNFRDRFSEEFAVSIRPHIGTPRQIKIKKEYKQRGVVLEKAVRMGVAGRERDEATAKSFLRSKRGLLQIAKPEEEFRLKKYKKDRSKRSHLRYEQVFKGIPVWSAELNVHLDQSGNVELVDGAFVPTPRKLVTEPVWSAEAAVAVALKAVAGGSSAVVDDPLLVVFAQDSRACRLAWKVELSLSVEADWLVIVDALNGSILSSYNQVSSNVVAGSGTDLFGHNQQLTLWQEGNVYKMSDKSKPMFDQASNPQGVINIYDMENRDDKAYLVSSQSSTSGWLPEAVSLTHNLSETYDYFQERHNRSSLDGNGGAISGIVRVKKDFHNAFWNSESNALFFGDAKPYAGALDVVAHEFTHGVTTYSCNLEYQGQSGALNESFSDIFGEMVEARTYGSNDWLHSSKLEPVQRSLKDPSSIEITDGYYYPAKMSQFYSNNHPLLEQFVGHDNGGVHINMTIVAHCFYLLAEGLDNAIGIQDAAKIFYRAQTVHLVRKSRFVDARLACIASAEEIFGASSVQVNKVKEAFDAVEIFDNTATPDPVPTKPVNANDSALFVYYDSMEDAYFLARYEQNLGDPVVGTPVSCYDLAQARPSVTGDGNRAFFVDSIADACFQLTNPATCESCLDLAGTIHSVAMSPDGNVYGVVLLDAAGEPTNQIVVVDLRKPEGQQTNVFSINAPATEGESLNTILYADSMDFTLDNRYLVYDAFNVFEFGSGEKIGVWGIYTLDIQSGMIYPIIQPYPDANYDVGYPSLSQTRDHTMVFDLVDNVTGKTSIVTYDFINGTHDVVGEVAGSWSVPGYNGDDSSIIYSVPDNATYTGHSLMQQSVSKNGLSPVGEPAWYVRDADYGVVFRRGAFNPPGQEDIDNDGDGYSENAGDCNDFDNSIHPGAVEICGDGIDQDCNGSDLVCPVAYIPGPYNYYLPYFRSGNGMWTGLGLANVDHNNKALFQVKVFDKFGNLLATENRDIPAYGQDAFPTAPQVNSSGWIHVNSHKLLSGLAFIGSTNIPMLMADIPFVSDLSLCLVVPHIAQDNIWDTTILVCNPHAEAASVVLQYVNKAGVVLGSKNYTIPKYGSGEYLLSTLFSANIPLAGRVEVNSSQGLAGFALYTDKKKGGTYYAGINAESCD